MIANIAGNSYPREVGRSLRLHPYSGVIYVFRAKRGSHVT
jgi:hypothetical protein